MLVFVELLTLWEKLRTCHLHEAIKNRRENNDAQLCSQIWSTVSLQFYWSAQGNDSHPILFFYPAQWTRRRPTHFECFFYFQLHLFRCHKEDDLKSIVKKHVLYVSIKYSSTASKYRQIHTVHTIREKAYFQILDLGQCF